MFSGQLKGAVLSILPGTWTKRSALYKYTVCATALTVPPMLSRSAIFNVSATAGVLGSGVSAMVFDATLVSDPLSICSVVWDKEDKLVLS